MNLSVMEMMAKAAFLVKGRAFSLSYVKRGALPMARLPTVVADRVFARVAFGFD